ncbi:MAG: ATPase domain-containing protein [Nanoarchaeota archaeon]
MKKGAEESRVASGISGFDELCEGGFVRNSTNLITGESGTGKTTFMIQFLFTGASVHSEKGLFISFGQGADEVNESANSFGWNLSKSSSSLKVAGINPRKSLKAIREEIHGLISRSGAERVCIDCLDLIIAEKESEMLEFILELFDSIRKAGVSSIISYSSKENSDNLELEFIKSLSDGIIQLLPSWGDEETDRAIRIVKMRQTAHSRGHNLFEITDKGMIVYE